MSTSVEHDRAETLREFREVVNVTPHRLEQWLETEESRSVGQKGEDGTESVGHESGRRIVELLRTKQADLTDDDLAHMRKVVGYVRRHLAQGGPDEDVEHSRWRYSLLNWGHDPLRD